MPATKTRRRVNHWATGHTSLIKRQTRQERHRARQDVALRLLSDEDLTGLVEWLHRPETRQASEFPPHLVAAWQSAWERAGGTLPAQ